MDLVQSLLDLLERFRSEFANVDAFDLTTKVGKLGGVSRCWEGKRDEFNGHCASSVQWTIGLQVCKVPVLIETPIYTVPKPRSGTA